MALRQILAILALMFLMVVYLPFFALGIACDAVGRHVVDLAERLDAWVGL